MAGSPKFKLYTDTGEYFAAFKYPMDAIRTIQVVYGDNIGYTLRFGHAKRNIVYTVGADESYEILDSYDAALDLVLDRIDSIKGYVDLSLRQG